MPTQKDPWPHGTPCWVDVMVDDADAARAFYTALFGWTADPGPPEFGGYTMCLLEGRPVAGLSPKPESWPGPNVWSTYLAVDDADATMARAAVEDGTVVVEPVTVGPMGRMAFGADPPAAGTACGRRVSTPACRSSTSPGRWSGTSC